MKAITKLAIDGELVPIGGTTAGVTGVAENVYSTEETRIGTWIDGKPLYRKVYSLVTPSTVTSSSVAVATYPTTFEIKTIKGSLHQPTTNWYVPLPAVANEHTYFTVYLANGDFRIYVGHANYINSPCIIVLEYTKTTD